jgi:hypothetical protein
MQLRHWFTFGRLEPELRDPFTYAIFAGVWASLIFAVWAISPWSPWI